MSCVTQPVAAGSGKRAGVGQLALICGHRSCHSTRAKLLAALRRLQWEGDVDCCAVSPGGGVS